MNLNNLRLGIKSQINTAIKAGLDVDGASEILNAELQTLLKRAQILEVVPFPEEIAGISEGEMEQYITTYQAMMGEWYKRAPDLFQLVIEVEELRFEEVISKAGLVTRLLDLAETVQTNTRTQWDEIKNLFGMGNKTWVRRIQDVADKAEGKEVVIDKTLTEAA